MQFLSIILALTTASSVFAQSTSLAVTTSVSCSNGESVCGTGSDSVCYDPTKFICCNTSGSLCGSGSYCTTDSDQNAACCAVGFNCQGQGSSTASLASATIVKSGSTATGAAVSVSTGMFSIIHLVIS